jgi:hypothetical protein
MVFLYQEERFHIGKDGGGDGNEKGQMCLPAERVLEAHGNS